MTNTRTVICSVSGIIIGEGATAAEAWSNAYTTKAGAYRPGFYDDFSPVTYNPARYRAVLGRRLSRV